ncbi:hypothetical protein O181_048246 [Austropuccinia psidii MF-1]|uniref:Uncharacterized protein n=1 Tax=Austropuccinia psidii MF-1 TaxID=1389203 RepID=A0A9Q3DQC4_9BASI|nr:hypothetical protein [Austropuccinia psidii MF-1]
MPEPQSTDGGSAEGEVSVSSISLELMTKYYASRRIQDVRIMHFKRENFVKEVGTLLNYGPPQSPQNKDTRSSWAQITTQDLPFSFGKVRFVSLKGIFIYPEDHK